MASIKFDNISFSYGDRQILKNFSLEVDDSQIMCLVGPSGCGKTTLIRCLLGFNKPSTANTRATCPASCPAASSRGLPLQGHWSAPMR